MPESCFCRSWPPEQSPQAHLVIVHGYAEHSGRYEALARELNDAGLHVHACDLRGHGETPGKRGQIKDFTTLVADLRHFVDQTRERVGGKPLFILGHSMGGLLTAHYLAGEPIGICGAIFSSPLMAIPDHVAPLLLRMSGLLSRVAPGLPVDRIESKGIARDPEVVRAYDTDPHVYHGPIRARTGAELAHAIQALPDIVPRITTPFLVFHGTADTIAPPSGIQLLIERAGSTDKTRFWVEGGYHELLNDTGRGEVIQKVLAWIGRHHASSGGH
ncbi:MAG: lysophospholipase [Candidatus Hydrogenedentes bacterium]|nr:lysophospholipase [Candidatus Hydrogenedentota bacterium]